MSDGLFHQPHDFRVNTPVAECRAPGDFQGAVGFHRSGEIRLPACHGEWIALVIPGNGGQDERSIFNTVR